MEYNNIKQLEKKFKNNWLVFSDLLDTINNEDVDLEGRALKKAKYLASLPVDMFGMPVFPSQIENTPSHNNHLPYHPNTSTNNPNEEGESLNFGRASFKQANFSDLKFESHQNFSKKREAFQEALLYSRVNNNLPFMMRENKKMRLKI